MINNIYNTGGFSNYRVGGPRRHIPAWAKRRYGIGGILKKAAMGPVLGSVFRGGGNRYYQGGGMYGNNNLGNTASTVFNEQSRADDQAAIQKLLGDSNWQNKFWNEQSQKQAMNQQVSQAATQAGTAGMEALTGNQAAPGGGGGMSAAGSLASAAGDYMQFMGGDDDPTTITGKEKTGAMLSGAG